MSAPLDTSTWRAVVAYETALRAQQRARKRLRCVDLFAGAGGASWGATLAGVDVVAAVNHDPVAVAAHAAALPWAAHMIEDLMRLSPMALPSHDIMWASSECTGHTRARGAEASHHDASRATAWCPVRMADYHRPRCVVVENVVDFESWPLLPAWSLAWKCLGYREQRIRLLAADHGVPQLRERLFFVFTHEARVKRAPDLSTPPKLPHVASRTVVDLDTSRGKWSRWSTYAERSRRRIASALEHQGGPCLVPYYGSASSDRGWSLDRPCGTLTRVDRFVVVVGEFARVLSVSEVLAIGGFPPDYPLAGTRRDRIGHVGASVVPACAEWLCSQVAKVL